jgi:two-component system OmpR family sensor kinase
VPERGFSNEGGYRYYSRFLPSEKVWIVVAQDLRERKEAATGLWIGLASPLLALLPIAAFAVWWTVGRATEPISRVSSELEARGGDHLEPIDAAGLPAELTPVIEAVNTLMKRLKAALDSERAFAANAAHELRNPIASARAQVQLLAGNLRGTTDSARAENIASQLGQLGRRIEKLLQMSRATAGLGHARERTDLFAITGLIADDYKRRPDVGDRLQLEPGNGTDCWVAMDPDALAIVVRNAVENAVHHGADGEPIKVRVEAGHALHIVNACPVVPSETLQELKARFRRGGLSRTTGSGLGLAIVDTLMRQAGGSATLASPAGGRQDGFEIVLKFPGAL